MNSQKLFVKNVPELECLSETPKVFWYASAGRDFRGPVFFTNHHIHRMSSPGFKKPELFIFTSIGPEIHELKNDIRNYARVVYNDNITKVKVRKYKELDILPHFRFKIDYNHVSDIMVERYPPGRKGIYFELEIIGNDYNEIQKVLYFEKENIDTFKKLVLQHRLFDVQYLCATREGCGFGGCCKSIVDYIYKDHAPYFFSHKGFKPEFNILFNDFSRTLFKQEMDRVDTASYYENFFHYIPEKGRYFQNQTIFRLFYRGDPLKNHKIEVTKLIFNPKSYI
ncbi:hypothetical protein [Psychroflexus tropicus]|uniref:DUF7663 domain-containing protein n=1 Tax=Psychroflexus tropicus TaxID=197345 RepID=UPI00036C6C60|nr:hypothetical protein [Psychroflexus tropicus]